LSGAGLVALARSVLTINSGSSSIKFAVFAENGAEKPVLKGQAQRIGIQGSSFQATDDAGREVARECRPLPDHQAALKLVLESAHAGTRHVQAVGHRIVRGGLQDKEPQLVTPALVERIRELIPYLPDHLPHQVAGIEAVRDFDPALAQVACFDTAFHCTMPRVAQLYALPRELADDGILRYGYHGLSYEYVISELAKQDGEMVARGRVIIAHLGNGCSMAAIGDGSALDTTMGFTPTGGLAMSSRSGDLDPEVILYLLQHRKLTVSAVNEMINRKAGLAGVSGGSSDMRDLLAREAADTHAAEAIELFCYQARKFLGALAAVLGGIDTLVFTAGIGENSPQIRERICAGMGHLGLIIDPRANQANAARISAAESSASIRVIPTNEELMIARHTLAVLKTSGKVTGLRD
jgi:acetate kinase